MGIARRLARMLSPLLLMGCVAMGPQFKAIAPPADKEALLYVYREPSWEFGAREATFQLDGKDVFNLASGGYSFIYVPAGKHELTQNWGYWLGDAKELQQHTLIPLDLSAGETRYIRFGASSKQPGPGTPANVMFTLLWGMDAVSPEVAAQEIADQRLQQPKMTRLSGN